MTVSLALVKNINHEEDPDFNHEEHEEHEDQKDFLGQFLEIPGRTLRYLRGRLIFQH